MTKRKHDFDETKEEFFKRMGIYSTSHRKFAWLGREFVLEGRRKKKPRMASPQSGSVNSSPKQQDGSSTLSIKSSTKAFNAAMSPRRATTTRRPTKNFSKSTTTLPTSQGFTVGSQKHLFLVEGAMTVAGSEQYDYLSQIYARGSTDLLPKTGRAKEILPIPMAPGVWNITPGFSKKASIQQQSDWEGKCFTLRNEAYPEAVFTRSQFRVSRLEPHFSCDIGSLTLVAFDGFGSSEEQRFYQRELAKVVLEKGREQSWKNQPTPMLSEFQAGRLCGSGGVAVAVRIGAVQSGLFRLKVTSCEKSNQIVAVQVSMHSVYSSSSVESRTIPLSARNLTQHTKKHQKTTKPLGPATLLANRRLANANLSPSRDDNRSTGHDVLDENLRRNNLKQQPTNEAEGRSRTSTVQTACEMDEDGVSSAMFTCEQSPSRSVLIFTEKNDNAHHEYQAAFSADYNRNNAQARNGKSTEMICNDKESVELGSSEHTFASPLRSVLVQAERSNNSRCKEGSSFATGHKDNQTRARNSTARILKNMDEESVTLGMPNSVQACASPRRPVLVLKEQNSNVLYESKARFSARYTENEEFVQLGGNRSRDGDTNFSEAAPDTGRKATPLAMVSVPRLQFSPRATEDEVPISGRESFSPDGPQVVDMGRQSEECKAHEEKQLGRSFHNVLFGVHDDQAHTDVDHFEDADLISYAEEPGEPSLHDIMFGQTSTEAQSQPFLVDWLGGIILLSLFAVWLHLYCPAITNIDYIKDNPIDINAIIRGGEGFAQFVYAT